MKIFTLAILVLSTFNININSSYAQTVVSSDEPTKPIAVCSQREFNPTSGQMVIRVIRTSAGPVWAQILLVNGRPSTQNNVEYAARITELNGSTSIASYDSTGNLARLLSVDKNQIDGHFNGTLQIGNVFYEVDCLRP
jgi:hypothetical protein